MALKYLFVILSLFNVWHLDAQKSCPSPKSILPCRCFLRGDEYQIWCTHSDLPSVLEGLKNAAKSIKDPVDEVILENNYLPAFPGRAFGSLKMLRLMLRHNGLERVSNDWLAGLEDTLMELFLVEPKLRTLPEDSLINQVALQAVTIQTHLMKRLPMFSGLPKLKHLQLESNALLELSPRNFKDNPNLEKLYLGQCPRLVEIQTGVFRDLPKLKLLNISNCGVNHLHHRSLMGLPALQELILERNRMSDANMIGRAVRELPKLILLSLDDNFIDQLGEGAFVDLPHLRTLHLSNNRITELHHGAFHRVPRLRKLHLNGNLLRRVHPESFLQQSGSGLQELFLIGNDIGHVADLRAILDALPRLTYLDMSFNRLEAIPYGALRGHATLEYFNLDHNRLHLIDRGAFVAMPALRELRLRNNSLSDTETPWWELPNLKGLDLSENYFRKISANFLENLPALRKVNLARNQLNFIDPNVFTLSPALEHINISWNNLATVHPATFRPLMGLYELDMSHNGLMEFVPGLPRVVEYLHLKNNEITALPTAPSPDLDLPALRMLDLSGNRIEIIDKNGLSTMPQIKRLFLNGNNLKRLEDGCLSGLEKLEILDVAANGLIHFGTKTLQEQKELRELSLGDNRLEYLHPEVFHSCAHLKRLNLSSNTLAELLPGTLDSNQDLQSLDLSNNRLVKVHPGNFQKLQNLRYLDLTRNRLNSLNPDVLGQLPALRTLKLSRNFIKELKEDAFSNLRHLSSLDLEENELEVMEPAAINHMPILRRVNLSRNKLQTLPDGAFLDLPALQIMELQENALKLIEPEAFEGLPQLLMLNLSYNQLEALDRAGLDGARSLELLDISHNLIRNLASSSLENLEWLVELRLDDNKICGVKGSGFNNMPRLRVITLRNNKMMSFPEKAIERIRTNLAVLDIEGNPLACACNMAWMHGWLQETNLKGPKCQNGRLLSEMNDLRENCGEQERQVDLVAPGCESELLDAPEGVGKPPWMQVKAVNATENRLMPPSPEQSEYFFDDFIDLNETKGFLTTPRSSDIVPGDTPTIYAAPKGRPPQDIPKGIPDSPSSSGFTFFGIPLPQLALFNNAINLRKEDATTVPSADDRAAIVNNPKPGPPDPPLIETGGFTPLLPGTGGFKPIHPIRDEHPAQNSPRNDIVLQTESTTPLDTTTLYTTDATTVTPVKKSGIISFLEHPLAAVSKTILASTYEKFDNSSNDKRSPSKYYNSTSMILKKDFFTSTEYTVTDPDGDIDDETLAPTTESSTFSKNNIPLSAFLIPSGLPKVMATITKVASVSKSAPLQSDDDLSLSNREPKTIAPDGGDMSWYFENYNNTKVDPENVLNGAGRGQLLISLLLSLFLFIFMY
ncbi:hypothetical protein ABEB36_011610 [Hypothenemus hampei]|uniref:Uncharacterized protein n=1 Tax=Hypothenemus hampei TaxID=57062 RepID=A0ABD1E8E7_HYPHA